MKFIFPTRLKECRKEKGFSQAEIARKIESHYSIIGKYERDEVKTTIEVVKKMSDVLHTTTTTTTTTTTVGYLLGETQDRELLKDSSLLRRLNDISKFPENDKSCILWMSGLTM